MKRALVLFLVIILSVSTLYGCGKKDDVPEDPIIPNVDTPQEDETSSKEAEDPGITDADDNTPPAEGMVRSKLTNEWISQEQADARPIAVMMPTDKGAQPQYGIGQADILYECMEEGNISRQMAVIDDWQNLEKIGNVRSCRDYYLYMACEWDPVLIHFGGVYYMRERIKKGDIQNISGTYSDGTKETSAPGAGAFFRTKDKASPHNAYVSAESVQKAMDSLGYPSTHRSEYYQPDHFQFASGTNTLADASDAVNASVVDLSDCYPISKSFLEYNEADGLYYKSLYGESQIDAANGQQLTFSNIIIQSAYWEKRDEKYLAFRMHDTTHTGYFVTKGKAIPVRWEKTSDYGPTRYYDMQGNEVQLNTGKTYIAIVQDGTTPRFQ